MNCTHGHRVASDSGLTDVRKQVHTMDLAKKGLVIMKPAVEAIRTSAPVTPGCSPMHPTSITPVPMANAMEVSASQTLIKQVSRPRMSEPGAVTVAQPVPLPLSLNRQSVVTPSGPSVSLRATQVTISATGSLGSSSGQPLSGYHMPRGAAAVANIASPRSAVATPIVRGPVAPQTANTVSVTTSPASGSPYSSSVKVATPTVLPRACISSGATVTTWIAGSGTTALSKSQVPTSAVPGYAQVRTTPITGSRSLAPATGTMRVQSDSPRPSIVQKLAPVSQHVTQLHIPEKGFTRPTVGIMSPRPATPIMTYSAPSRITVTTVTGPTTSAPLRQTSSQLPLKATVSALPHNTGPKVITQPAHGPAIQITQVPAATLQPKVSQPSIHPVTSLQQTGAAISTMVTRTVAYTTQTTPITTSVTNAIRPPVTTQSSTTPIPVAKVYPQPLTGVSRQEQETVGQNQPSSQNITTGLFVQTTHRASPAPTVSPSERNTASSFPLPAYYYDSSGTSFQVTGSLVAHSYPGSTLRPASVHSIVSSAAPVRFNPVMVVDSSRSTTVPVHSAFTTEGSVVQAEFTPVTTSHCSQQPTTKANASPRPSILRKRECDGNSLKAQKSLAPVLAALAPASPPSPKRPDSRGGGSGNSSGGSTTISATSSPGLGLEGNDDSLQSPTIKQEPPDEPEPQPVAIPVQLPVVEMSPRKKPRKQQLTSNELPEQRYGGEEMEFLSEERIKKEVKDEEEERIYVPRRTTVSLLNSYRHTWKSRHNHYQRYSEVRPRDERRPTVSDIASHKNVLQKVNGWKVHHLSTQMEELAELETQVHERLRGVLRVTERPFDRELDRINELIKANMQRSKVITDQIYEAKTQVMKIFEHKSFVVDIVSKYMSGKRQVKKRDKT